MGTTGCSGASPDRGSRRRGRVRDDPERRDDQRVLHDERGSLRVIDASVTKCGSKETALAWNVQGPAGPQGPQGAARTAGSDRARRASGATGAGRSAGARRALPGVSAASSTAATRRLSSARRCQTSPLCSCPRGATSSQVRRGSMEALPLSAGSRQTARICTTPSRRPIRSQTSTIDAFCGPTTKAVRKPSR